jgi:hypothetical protein
MMWRQNDGRFRIVGSISGRYNIRIDVGDGSRSRKGIERKRIIRKGKIERGGRIERIGVGKGIERLIFGIKVGISRIVVELG